jgi:hypothetical protein
VYEVASFATCESQFNNMPHIEQVACYKKNDRPNFRLLSKTKYDETKNEHAFHQIEDEENEHDVCIL